MTVLKISYPKLTKALSYLFMVLCCAPNDRLMCHSVEIYLVVESVMKPVAGLSSQVLKQASVIHPSSDAVTGHKSCSNSKDRDKTSFSEC